MATNGSASAPRSGCCFDRSRSRPSHRRSVWTRRRATSLSCLDFVAYRLDENAPALEPASRWRSWMNETDERWANRCLPLLVANESGWVLLNSHGFTATWSGGRDSAATSIEFDEGELPAPPPVSSHFGYGIITWVVPYLF